MRKGGVMQPLSIEGVKSGVAHTINFRNALQCNVLPDGFDNFCCFVVLVLERREETICQTLKQGQSASNYGRSYEWVCSAW